MVSEVGIIIRLYSGASSGTHCEGKDGPNRGIRAPEMLAQNVVQIASAHG